MKTTSITLRDDSLNRLNNFLTGPRKNPDKCLRSQQAPGARAEGDTEECIKFQHIKPSYLCLKYGIGYPNAETGI